jgi:hypothetical protein
MAQPLFTRDLIRQARSSGGLRLWLVRDGASFIPSCF